jgi:hypothetical protein
MLKQHYPPVPNVSDEFGKPVRGIIEKIFLELQDIRDTYLPENPDDALLVRFHLEFEGWEIRTGPESPADDTGGFWSNTGLLKTDNDEYLRGFATDLLADTLDEYRNYVEAWQEEKGEK